MKFSSVYRSFRALFHTPVAEMTKGGIDNRITIDNFNSVVRTDFHAFSAPGTIVSIDKKLSTFNRPLAGDEQNE